MQISNKIVLRPRFTLELNTDPNLVLEAFEAAKNSQDAIKINVLDAHVFLKIPSGTATLLVATTPFRSFRGYPSFLYGQRFIWPQPYGLDVVYVFSFCDRQFIFRVWGLDVLQLVFGHSVYISTAIDVPDGDCMDFPIH